MANINAQDILQQMLTAAQGVLQKHWDKAQGPVSEDLKEIAEFFVKIEAQKASGTISEKKAKIKLGILKKSVRIHMLTIQGLSKLAVEELINAVLDVIKSTVNTAIGWTLL